MSASSGSQPALLSPAATTVVDLLWRRAVEDPEWVAYSFSTTGEDAGIPAGHLDMRARAAGNWLASFSSPGERCVVLCPTGPEFLAGFFGALYAGAIAVPVDPLDSERRPWMVSRLRSIIHDAQPVAVLTTARLLPEIKGLLPDMAKAGAPRWAAVDEIPDSLSGEWRCPAIQPEAPAVVQYGSAPARTPLGIVLSHRNILASAQAACSELGQSADLTYVGWMPLAGDWGLMFQLMQPMYAGVRSVLISTEEFLEDPSRWLQAISRHRNAISGATSFGYELCARRVQRVEGSGLDLAGWRTAAVAGPVHPDTLDRFVNRFRDDGFRREAFRPAYSLGEATLLVSVSGGPKFCLLDGQAGDCSAAGAGSAASAPPDAVLSCGAPLHNLTAAIVDPGAGTACPPGGIGEIWVSGDSVAQGYWNKPEETQRRFQNSVAAAANRTFLRTGGLGFFKEGKLFATGWLEDAVFARGEKYFVAHLESTIRQCHGDLQANPVAVFGVQKAGEQLLVVVGESSLAQQDSEVTAAVRRALLAEHGLHADEILLVPTGTIPLTPDGAVRRDALRARYTEGALHHVTAAQSGARVEPQRQPGLDAPRSPTEKALADIWSSLLGVDDIGLHDTFVDLGGHSLLGMQCIARFRTALGVDIPLPILLSDAANLATLAEHIDRLRSGADVSSAGSESYRR